MPTDLSVTPDHRPGTLAVLCVALERAGVTVEAICRDVSDETGFDHFVVDDASTARRVIARQGCEVRSERDVVIIDLEDRPDALGEATRMLESAGTQVDLIYLATGHRLVVAGRGLDEPARNRLSELATAARGPSTEWDRLTKSETKVVRYVAMGLTNAEIASQLHVAPRTIRSHLEHVFKKLGIRSRVELAAKFARRGIRDADDG